MSVRSDFDFRSGFDKNLFHQFLVRQKVSFLVDPSLSIFFFYCVQGQIGDAYECWHEILSYAEKVRCGYVV